MVLHRNQCIVNFIFHFPELHIGISITYKILRFEIIFSNVIKSEYILYPVFHSILFIYLNNLFARLVIFQGIQRRMV